MHGAFPFPVRRPPGPLARCVRLRCDVRLRPAGRRPLRYSSIRSGPRSQVCPSTNARKLLRSGIRRIASGCTQYSDKVYRHKAGSSNPSRCRIRSACEIGFQSRQEIDMCGNHEGCTFVGSKHDHDQNISTQPRTHDFSLHEHFSARLFCATQAGFPRCRRYRPLRSRLAGPGYPVAREARA